LKPWQSAAASGKVKALALRASAANGAPPWRGGRFQGWRARCRARANRALSGANFCRRRREQVAAAAKIEQPALFEMKEDCRPASERTAAGRCAEPSLFAFIGQER